MQYIYNFAMSHPVIFLIMFVFYVRDIFNLETYFNQQTLPLR